MKPAGCSVVCGESSVYLGGTAAPPPCALVERDGRWLSRLTQHYDLQAALHVQIEYHPMATGWRRPATSVLASPSGALATGLWRCHGSLILHSAIVDWLTALLSPVSSGRGGHPDGQPQRQAEAANGVART
jgi:hypothetical protein